MYTKDDILARLINGETSDAIAQEMTDALNEAQELYIKEQDQKIKENELKEAKRARMTEIVGLINDYCRDFLPDMPVENVIDPTEIDDLIDTIESFIPLIKLAVAASEAPFTKPTEGDGIKVEVKKGPKIKVNKSADDIINEFLTNFKLV